MASESIQMTHDHPTEKGSISVSIVGESRNIVGNHEVTIDGKIYTVSKSMLARRVLARMLEVEFNGVMYSDELSESRSSFLDYSVEMKRLAESAIQFLASEDTDFQGEMETLGLDIDKLKSSLWTSTDVLFPGCQFHVDFDDYRTEQFSLFGAKTIHWDSNGDCFLLRN